MRLSILLLFGTVFIPPAPAATPRFQLATQVSSARTRHLLLELMGDADNRVEKITLKFPKDVDVKRISEGVLPAGWQLKLSSRKLRLVGPPTQLPFRARLELGRQDAPLQVNVRITGGGEELFAREGLFLKILPKLEVRDKLRGLMALPPLLVPGDHVEMRLLNPLLTPPAGTWTIAGTKVQAQPDPKLKTETGQAWLLSYTVPSDLDSATPIQVSYHDALGLRTVFVTDNEHTRFAPTPSRTPQQPRLIGCAVLAVKGGGLCVGGWFPNGETRSGLRIDGKPAGEPITASNQALYLPIPPSLSAGVHHLSGDPKLGFPADVSVPFTVIDVQAELDKGELVEGQTAALSFFVVGSKSPMKIRVINTTPDIISIDGGDEQVIETFGGGGNIATRTIETQALGNFVIKYEVAEKRCPCLEQLDEEGLIPE